MIPPFKRYPLEVRLALMFCLLVVNYLLFPFFAVSVLLPFVNLGHLQEIAAGNFTNESDKFAFLFIQAIGSMGAFGFTAVLFSQLENGRVARHLHINVLPSLKFITLALFAVFTSQFFLEFLVEINQKIPLPDSLQFIVEMGKRDLEVQNTLLSGNSFLRFILNVVVLAAVPALAEELFFRGLLLGNLLKQKINPAAAIFATGFIFALVHLQFENFIAIWLLGAFLGYLYYVSGSLWLPIVAHFTNNFLAVLFKYLYNTCVISSDFAEASAPMYATVISILLFSGSIFLFHKWKNPATFAEESETEPPNENTLHE